MVRRPAAKGGEQPPALPATVRIVDPTVHPLGVETHGIRYAHHHPLTVPEGQQSFRQVAGVDRHIGTQAQRVELVHPGIVAPLGATGIIHAFELRQWFRIQRPPLRAVLPRRLRPVEWPGAQAPIETRHVAARQRRPHHPVPIDVHATRRIALYGGGPPISDLKADTIGVSGIGTIAAAKVTPRDSEEEAFIVVSMYARWLKPHPSTKSRWKVGYSDASVHRIISDLSAFIGHRDPATHRILATGDLSMFYEATGGTLSLPARDRTVWERTQALGLEFLGPQASHGRRAESAPTDVPSATKNVPTYYAKGGPDTAVNQLDDAFASRPGQLRHSAR